MAGSSPKTRDSRLRPSRARRVGGRQRPWRELERVARTRFGVMAFRSPRSGEAVGIQRQPDHDQPERLGLGYGFFGSRRPGNLRFTRGAGLSSTASRELGKAGRTKHPRKGLRLAPRPRHLGVEPHRNHARALDGPGEWPEFTEAMGVSTPGWGEGAESRAFPTEPIRALRLPRGPRFWWIQAPVPESIQAMAFSTPPGGARGVEISAFLADRSGYFDAPGPRFEPSRH
jgi:hypothetical protein